MLNRPLLLVDIDGVLNPHVSPSVAMPSHYAAHQVGGQRVWLAAMHGEWLHWLSGHFDLAWATTWEADANELIGPIIGAPPALPTIHFDQLDEHGWTWKLPAVQAFVGDRALAWLDDEPGFGVEEWASTRLEPTLLVKPNGYFGWTAAEFDELVTFAKELEAGS